MTFFQKKTIYKCIFQHNSFFRQKKHDIVVYIPIDEKKPDFFLKNRHQTDLRIFGYYFFTSNYHYNVGLKFSKFET